MLDFPKLHIGTFDRMVLDGEEYLIHGRESRDSFDVEDLTTGVREPMHIDEIGNKLDMADHVELIG